jgi:hypothetical protein
LEQDEKAKNITAILTRRDTDDAANITADDNRYLTSLCYERLSIAKTRLAAVRAKLQVLAVIVEQGAWCLFLQCVLS